MAWCGAVRCLVKGRTLLLAPLSHLNISQRCASFILTVNENHRHTECELEVQNSQRSDLQKGDVICVPKFCFCCLCLTLSVVAVADINNNQKRVGVLTAALREARLNAKFHKEAGKVRKYEAASWLDATS